MYDQYGQEIEYEGEGEGEDVDDDDDDVELQDDRIQMNQKEDIHQLIDDPYSENFQEVGSREIQYRSDDEEEQEDGQKQNPYMQQHHYEQ